MLPKKVNVAGVNFSVEAVPVVEIHDNKNYNGACWHSKTKIEILDLLSEERKKEVFVHELTHALFFEAEFDDDIHTEETVKRLGRVLFQVLRENDFSFLREESDNEKDDG
jgi:hypothetical protein